MSGQLTEARGLPKTPAGWITWLALIAGFLLVNRLLNRVLGPKLPSWFTGPAFPSWSSQSWFFTAQLFAFFGILLAVLAVIGWRLPP